MFCATKVWTTGESNGIAQMESSMSKMTANPMDLMQIHNLKDWKTHLKTLYRWKETGKIRYIGITHYLDGYHRQLDRILKTENIDFIQDNYSMAEKNAENFLLSSAMENGVGVIVNRPYAGGTLFQKVKGKAVPDWAKEFDCNSWGQFFLKYLLAHKAVTCVIPGTAKPHHMKDNLGAGKGRMPDKSEREKMVRYMQSM